MEPFSFTRIAAMAALIERLFRVRASGSTPGREVLGGLTTFLTMAYIIAVNPVFLTTAGMPLEGAIVATCLAAAFATLLMAFLANYPIALAPGMGMNAFFAYTICLGAKVPWPTALGLVFWSGVLLVLLTLTGARALIVRAVPRVITLAGAVGIGLFIAFIGLQQGGLLKADPHTLVTLGDLVARPAAIFRAPSLDLPGLRIDLLGALQLRYLPLILVMLFFALFDTLGTLMAIAHQAGFLRRGGEGEREELPRMGRALAADAAGMVGGALFGTSAVTSYIESGAGVGVGARTGLANVVTAALLLLSLFVSPLIEMVGRAAGPGLNPVTAPALIMVGTIMVRAVREIDWEDLT